MYRAIVAFLLLFSVQASGQDESNFYTGRTVSILVGSGAGGLTDTSARLIARFLERHIPGEPTVIVQNMPGGGGVSPWLPTCFDQLPATVPSWAIPHRG